MPPKLSGTAVAIAIIVGAAGVEAGQPLSVTIDGLSVHGALPDSAAFCRSISPISVAPGPNQSLGVTWSPGPDGTRSYALTMVDPDVPQDLSTLNRAELNIPVDAPRTTFTHWVLADIPANTTALPAGIDGGGQVEGGKPLGITSHGVRGQNGYARFFQGGTYGGYDGPCPPWNDLRAHRYLVRVYALDLPTLGLSVPFIREDMETAMAGHVLASGETGGMYTLNPNLRQ